MAKVTVTDPYADLRAQLAAMQAQQDQGYDPLQAALAAVQQGPYGGQDPQEFYLANGGAMAPSKYTAQNMLNVQKFLQGNQQDVVGNNLDLAKYMSDAEQDQLANQFRQSEFQAKYGDPDATAAMISRILEGNGIDFVEVMENGSPEDISNVFKVVGGPLGWTNPDTGEVEVNEPRIATMTRAYQGERSFRDQAAAEQAARPTTMIGGRFAYADDPEAVSSARDEYAKRVAAPAQYDWGNAPAPKDITIRTKAADAQRGQAAKQAADQAQWKANNPDNVPSWIARNVLGTREKSPNEKAAAAKKKEKNTWKGLWGWMMGD